MSMIASFPITTIFGSALSVSAEYFTDLVQLHNVDKPIHQQILKPDILFQEIRHKINNSTDLLSMDIKYSENGGFIVEGVPVSRWDYVSCFIFGRASNFNYPKFYEDVKNNLLLRELRSRKYNLRTKIIYENIPNGTKPFIQDAIPNKQYQQLIMQCLTQIADEKLLIPQNFVPPNSVIYQLIHPPFGTKKQMKIIYTLQGIMNICSKWMINVSSEEYKHKPWLPYKKGELESYLKKPSKQIIINLIDNDDDNNEDIDNGDNDYDKGYGYNGYAHNDDEEKSIKQEFDDDDSDDEYLLPQPKYSKGNII